MGFPGLFLCFPWGTQPGAVAVHFPGPRSIAAAGQRPGAPGGHCTVYWEDLHLHVAWLESSGDFWILTGPGKLTVCSEK